MPTAQEPNLEAMLSILTESLDRAKQSRDANFTLLATYAKVFEGIINQFSRLQAKARRRCRRLASFLSGPAGRSARRELPTAGTDVGGAKACEPRE